MTLRGGDALDEYRQSPVYDAALDPRDRCYLERFARACRTSTPHPGVTTCPGMLTTHFGIGRGPIFGSMRFSMRCGRRTEIRRSWRR